MECTEQNHDDEVKVMEEVELSSDEEEDDEVYLIVFKRPPAFKRNVHDAEVCITVYVVGRVPCYLIGITWVPLKERIQDPLKGRKLF